MKKTLFLLLTATTLLQGATLTVEIANKELEGRGTLTLYKGKEGFLKENMAFKTVSFKLSSNTTILNIEDLPEGEYAFTLYHDENRNGKLDKNFIKLPKEATGFSNNFRPKFKPNYENFKFDVVGDTLQKIDLK